MGIVFIIVGIIVLVILAITTEDSSIVWGSFFSTIIIMFGILIIDYEHTPSAIDVYRNKTELSVRGIYKDSIFTPTDTTVIFKKGLGH